jgi:hypothetical protein
VACLRCRKPFVRELLAAGDWTAKREEAADVANSRQPDLFKVQVRHRVDAEKSAIYEAGDVAGLELDAVVLLDEENRARSSLAARGCGYTPARRMNRPVLLRPPAVTLATGAFGRTWTSRPSSTRA